MPLAHAQDKHAYLLLLLRPEYSFNQDKHFSDQVERVRDFD